MVKGVLYTTAGTRRSVVALDGRDRRADLGRTATAKGSRAAIAPRQLSGRGVSYWTDGKGDERILYVTTGYRLVALNAKTGAMIPSFGEDGVVDLKKGAVFGKGQQIDLETGEIGLHSTPTVVKDVVIVGSSFKEGMTVKTHNNTKGHVRAFDVRTGKLLWTFNTIPRPGEFGNDTWENESWATNGNTGVWTQITVDEEARARLPAGRDADVGLLRRPSPGQQPVRREPGLRRPEDRPAQVALPDRAPSDLGLRPLVGADPRRHQRQRQGRSRRWRCRASRRSSTSSIASPASRCGRSRNVRCRRATCPARRRRRRSRSRPSRRRTARQAVGSRRSHRLHAGAATRRRCKLMSRYKLGPMFTAAGPEQGRRPARGADDRQHRPAAPTGRAAAYDPETHIVYAPGEQRSSIAPIGLVEPPEGFSDINYVSGTAGQPFRES